MKLLIRSIVVFLLPVVVNGISYTIPASLPSGAAALDPAPVGVSFEFFTFPSYFSNVTATNQCLQNFESLTGVWPNIRIGGTTQDRAQYDATTSAYVVYSVASPTGVPAALTFGSSFFSLAAAYAGTVVLGLNREYGNITNTISAAQVAKSTMSNLRAIELGNEPEYWGGIWTPAVDAESQDNWDILVGEALNTTNIIQAGNSNSGPPTWGAAELIATENITAQTYVYDYAHHNYPGGTVTSLMSHSKIVSNVTQFNADVAAATGTGKDYVFGETNSVSGGGAANVSPLFGAALWTMDYVLQASTNNIKRSYFHHGTIGLCYYCWWGRYNIGSPYYGAYAATAAMAGGSYISALDDGTTNYAAYLIYDSSENPLRVLLYNSDFHASGNRSSVSFKLRGLTGVSITAKRLTAASANSRVDHGSNPTFGGQTFANGTCNIQGVETFETITVVNGAARFTLYASEALLVYLQ